MRAIGYGIGCALVLLLGCDQQASIGDRADAAAGADAGTTTHDSNLPTCGNYVFPPSPRLVRVVERSADGSSKNLLDLRYNSNGEIVEDSRTAGSFVIRAQYTYEGGRVTKIEVFRDGVRGIESNLSWQGDRFVGADGWFDSRAWSDTEEGGLTHISETRTYGLLGIEFIEARTTTNGNTSTSRRSFTYAETGMIDRWSIDGSTYEGTTELFYTSGRICRALRTTRYSSAEREVMFETKFTYDENGRLAFAEADTTTYTYFYNASGFISRIESERNGQRGVSLELTYEMGTTPSIQFHHAGFVTVRGEVTPMVSFTGYTIPINLLDSWLL